MKKFVLVFLLLLMIVCYASCHGSYRNELESVDTNTDFETFQLVSIVKNSDGNALTKTYFHNPDQKLYIIIYNYELDYYRNQIYFGIEFRMIDSPVKVTVNNITNQNQDSNSTQQCDECVKDTTIHSYESCNNNNIVVTIIDGKCNNPLNEWKYTLKIKNNSDANILIKSKDASFDNMMLFRFHEKILAGKTKEFSFNSRSIEEACINKLIGTLTRTVEIINIDTYDSIDETIVNIEFR